MNAVSIVGVVTAFGLVFLWLLMLCAEKGVCPFRRVWQGFRHLAAWEKTLLSIFVGVWIAFASVKDGGTNSVNQVEGETNTVTQVEGGTNQIENGEWIMENGEGTNSILHSPFSILHFDGGPLMLGRFGRPNLVQWMPTTITSNDIAQLWRIDATVDGNAFATPTANAVANLDWRDYGGMSDSLRIKPDGWRFPFGNGTTTGLTVFENGDFRPNVKTHFFPPPFDASLSLLPRWNWGLLPNGGESVFWHEQTPSNSLVLTWHNALYNRDANCPTNFQAELFADGRFDYRYPDRTILYAPVFPFDLDGDGLENSVDPEPLAAGPDAHGTNAEWYNVVCSNVFAAVEDPQGVELAPRTVHVNTNAYYFVDVIAERGPAPIYFNSSHPGRLGSPVVVALGGETNRVPLLIGATYSVTSDVPFTVSCPTNGFAEVTRRDGLNATVRWPLEFTFTEELLETNRIYTVDVAPYNPGGSFTWNSNHGGASLQGIAPPSTGGACGCVSGNGNRVTFGCSPSCTCGGNCLAVGAFSFEYAVFAVTGGVCRCGFDDPCPMPPPNYTLNDGPSFAITFSKTAVVFEDAYQDSPGVWMPKGSSRVRLTVSAYGGSNGGNISLATSNLSKIAPVACGPMVFPSSKELGAFESYYATFICEGLEESNSEGDVGVTGVFTDAATLQTIASEAELTVVKLELRAEKEARGNSCMNRHTFGICENVYCLQSPSSPQVVWNYSENGRISGMSPRSMTCTVCASTGGLTATVDDVVYRPKIKVVEPTAIKCERYGFLPADVLTGIGMALELYVCPYTVSFEGLQLKEVAAPSGATSPEWGIHTGYFNDPVFQQRWYHYANWGAGRWIAVQHGNQWGGYDQSRMMEWPSPWSTGDMTWQIPIAWKNPFLSYDAEGGRLPTVYTSSWSMTEAEIVKTKHQQELVLTSGGTIILNGEEQIGGQGNEE